MKLKDEAKWKTSRGLGEEVRVAFQNWSDEWLFKRMFVCLEKEEIVLFWFVF